jgi:hypothetical protein
MLDPPMLVVRAASFVGGYVWGLRRHDSPGRARLRRRRRDLARQGADPGVRGARQRHDQTLLSAIGMVGTALSFIARLWNTGRINLESLSDRHIFRLIGAAFRAPKR